MRTRIHWVVSALAGLFLGLVSLSAQISISGITDKAVYQNQARFTVSNESGYAYYAQLDGSRVPVGIEVVVNDYDYHELFVTRTNTTSGAVTNRLVRFILVTSERYCCDTGIPMWTPYPTISSSPAEFAGAHLRVITPASYPFGMDIPVVAWVENDEGHAVRANGWLMAPAADIRIRRGVGSGFVPAPASAGDFPCGFQIAGLQASNLISVESSPSWSNVSGILSGTVTWPENSRISVVGDLTITNGCVLTIGAGTVVRLSSLANIYVDNQVIINGTTNNPVVFAPANPAQPWGGFFIRTTSSRVTATGTIFTGAGGNPNMISSHRREQPLFHCPAAGVVMLTDCAAMYMAGQFGHSSSGTGGATLRLTRVLIQRCTTAGEYGPGVFMNDSAIIETPLESPDFVDGDNDAIYLTTGGNAFTNCLLGWTKDDAIDTGGSGSGINHVINCWLESTLHEGIAGSGNDKYVNLRDTVAINCGQGFEDGYQRMSNAVDHCLATANLSGARFGDNYLSGYAYDGFLRATNSLLLYNHRNIYGIAFNGPGTGWQTNSWVPRLAQMDLRSNYISEPDTNFPNNFLWNPATDGWRLASFLNTAPGAAVGLGFAVWSNRQDLALLLQGVPVRLSSFSTNFVSVDYTFLNANGTLASGTLTFVPGETLKRIFPWGFDLSAQAQVTVILGNPVNAVITELDEVIYQGSTPQPQLNLGVTGRQADLARLDDGLAVTLSSLPSMPASVNYTLEADGWNLGSGTLSFGLGQLYQWITAPGVNLDNYGIVRVTLSNPVGAPWSGANQLYLVRTPPPVALPPAETLVPAGGWWKYLDTGVNLGLAWSPSNPGGWSGTNFDDSVWPAGNAPMGYDYGGVERTTNSYGPNSSSKYITYYYRTYFNLTNASNYASLTFRLLRDDGAVVYINGAEVYRDNMPQGTVITNRTLSSTTVSGNTSTYLVTNVATSALDQPLHEGTNLLAIEVHQAAVTSSDLIMDLEVLANPNPPASARPTLYYGTFDRTNVVLGWSDGSYWLQGASNVSGGYGNVGATSPVAVSPTNQENYFRLRK